jgi:hypothetical protein
VLSTAGGEPGYADERDELVEDLDRHDDIFAY